MTDFAHRFTIEDGNGDRFTALFTKAWDALPRYARETIRTVWGGGIPAVKLTDNPITFWWKKPNKDGLPNEMTFGRYSMIDGLAFRAGWIDIAPDDVVCSLIVHELAHAYLSTCSLELSGNHQIELDASLDISEDDAKGHREMDVWETTDEWQSYYDPNVEAFNWFGNQGEESISRWCDEFRAKRIVIRDKGYERYASEVKEGLSVFYDD